MYVHVLLVVLFASLIMNNSVLFSCSLLYMLGKRQKGFHTLFVVKPLLKLRSDSIILGSDFFFLFVFCFSSFAVVISITYGRKSIYPPLSLKLMFMFYELIFDK